MAHLRWSGGVVSTLVNFNGDMTIQTKKEAFVASSINRQRFIIMLSDRLHASGCRTIHAEGDADTVIVQTAVRCADSGVTVVVGEDTDLLALLCYPVKPQSPNIYFRSDRKTKTKNRVWSIQWLQNSLSLRLTRLLLFAHAIAGCDTTSRLLPEVGTAVPLKIKHDPHFQELAAVFNRNANTEEVTSAGEPALVCMYNGNAGENLDAPRYRRFCEKVSLSASFVQVHTLPYAFVQVHTLPLTTAAARYCSIIIIIIIIRNLQSAFRNSKRFTIKL